MRNYKDTDVFYISSNLPRGLEDKFYKLHREVDDKKIVWAQGTYKKRLPIGHWQFFKKNGAIKWEQIFIK